MNLTDTPPAAAAPVPTPGETRLARVMFALAAVFLLLLAGLIHRAQQSQVTDTELRVMYGGLAALWPLFALEAIYGVLRRDRTKPRRPVLLRALLVVLLPPFRMGSPDTRTGLIWLPRLGWRPPGKELYKRLDVIFSGPMILFALLILPILALEYFRAAQVKSTPELALALHVAVALIWVAFATEFILDSAAAPEPLTHVKERWLDLAIVVLPMLDFILTKWVDAAPLARLLRLGRALAPEQIRGLQQAYRLRGVVTKAWTAFLVLGGMNRLLGNADAKRLRAVETEMATLEERLAELRAEAEELRAKVAASQAAPRA